MAQSAIVPVPVEIPGEDVATPPFSPMPAHRHLCINPEPSPTNSLSAEFDVPLKHDGWAEAWPEWDDLCVEEKLAELRLGHRSPFYFTFADDPTIWADCPDDGPVVVMAEGVCPHCGLEVPASKRVA